jgi:hypothetical protein
MEPDPVGQVSVYVYTPMSVGGAMVSVPFDGFDPLHAPDATQSPVVPLVIQPSCLADQYIKMPGVTVSVAESERTAPAGVVQVSV